MSASRVFANTPAAVAGARHFVSGELLDIPRHVADDIAVMVSELATNCVRHTDTDFSVRVEQSSTQIRVEVTDAGDGTPAIRSPAPSDLTGRGLRIVRELADSFGFRPATGSPGKTVWFVVLLSAEGSRAEAR